MDSCEESGELHGQDLQQHEFILGDRHGEEEFISPDLKTIIKEEEHFILKEEPNNPDEDLYMNLNEEDITEEPHRLEIQTESTGAVAQYECVISSNYCEDNGPYILGSVHPNDINTLQGSSSGMIDDNNMVLTQQLSCMEGNNTETIVLSDLQQQFSGSLGAGPNIESTDEDVQIMAFIPGPLSQVQPDDPEEEVQVHVSNKWIESRGETYVNLSILSGFPNPQITKSISLTREGIQIFIHKLPLKSNHHIWSLLRSNNELEKGQILSTIANLVEKMKVCMGCWDPKCRDLWEQGVFGELGFVEVGFSPSPVYRTYACNLLMEAKSRIDTCEECSLQWSSMIRILDKNRKEQIDCEPRDIDTINYKFLTKNDLVASLRESRKEICKYRKQIITLHREIDELVGRNRSGGSKVCNGKIVSINDRLN